jgi:predicted deacetylase
MRPSRQIVVSVHDVAPETRSRVEFLVEVLKAIGVSRLSLLVIPNFRGEGPIDADGEFCAWLGHRQQLGDEIVLHGYEHVGVGRPRNLTERVSHRWFTVGEGEFLSLDYDAAFDRIARARTILQRAGFEPKGFVAPAWLVTADGLRAARDLGFQYTNSYLAVTDLSLGHAHWAPSLVFGPGRLDEDVGIALQRPLALLLGRSAVLRVVLHPPCADDPRRLARVVSLIAQQRRDREPVTYLQLLRSLRRAVADAACGANAQ